MFDATLIEKSRRRVEVGSRRNAEAEVVESDPERVEAIRGIGSLLVDGTETDKHPLMHQDDPALQRIHQGLIVLVVGWRRGIHRDLKPEYLGVEGNRPPNIGDCQAQVMYRTHGKVRHRTSLTVSHRTVQAEDCPQAIVSNTRVTAVDRTRPK